MKSLGGTGARVNDDDEEDGRSRLHLARLEKLWTRQGRLTVNKNQELVGDFVYLARLKAEVAKIGKRSSARDIAVDKRVGG